jgi:single-strand DNA-binding protein
MANLNKVMLIGRLTRDPEPILTDKGAKFGFAVNNRKFDQAKNEWVDEPVFIDCEAWNRGETGQQAARILQNVRKGHQLFLEGRLKMDQWEDKNGGGKRSKLVLVVDNFQYLERREDGEGGGSRYEGSSRGAGSRPAPRAAAAGGGAYGKPASSYNTGVDEYGDDMGAAPAPGGKSPSADDDIPF